MFRKQVEVEITELSEGEFDVRFPADKTIDAGWDVSAIARAADELLADPDVDIVIAIGIASSHELAKRSELAKPVLAPFTADRRLQGLPYRDGASGVHNLCYLDSETDLAKEMAVFADLVSIDRMLVAASDIVLDSVPGFVESVEAEAGRRGLSVRVARVETRAQEVLDALDADTEGVFITPLLRFSGEEFRSLVAALNERKLPTFSFLGRSEVEQGVLAGAAQKEDLPRVARRIALNVQRILLGEDPADFPVAFAEKTRLSINLATARQIGFSPQWSILADADLLNAEKGRASERLTLEQAVREAVAANLDIAAKTHEVAAGAQDIRGSRSRLLPQLDMSSTATTIDDDRAAPTTAPERSLTAAFTLSQLVFSESALADVEVQADLQAAREAERDALELDVVLEAAVAYLNLLRASTLARIERNNLELTRANLETSKTRQAIGIASPAEVYRWESEIASEKKALVEAIAARLQAEVELNRVMSRPLGQPVTTVDVGLEGAQLGPGPRGFLSYISNPRKYGVFVDFLSTVGLDQAPELLQLSAAIAAQKRALLSAERALWLPTLALQGELSQKLAEGGTGSANSGAAGAGDPVSAALDGLFPDPDNTDWNLGLRLTVPLSSGGRRSAERDKAREQLGELLLRRKATAQRVESRIRTSLHAANASLQGIELARDAADAAAKNLNLVTDAYSRGVVSIIELLDAQNASLVAEQGAENAVYDFLVDFMNVSRSVSFFGFFATREDVEEIFTRLDAYFAAAGLPPEG